MLLLFAVTCTGNVFSGIFDTITPGVKTFAVELSSPKADLSYPSSFADSFIFEGRIPTTVSFSEDSGSLTSLFSKSNSALCQSVLPTQGLKDNFAGFIKTASGPAKTACRFIQNYCFTKYGLVIGGFVTTALLYHYWDKISDIQRRLKKVEKTVNDTNKTVKANHTINMQEHGKTQKRVNIVNKNVTENGTAISRLQAKIAELKKTLLEKLNGIDTTATSALNQATVNGQKLDKQDKKLDENMHELRAKLSAVLADNIKYGNSYIENNALLKVIFKALFPDQEFPFTYVANVAVPRDSLLRNMEPSTLSFIAKLNNPVHGNINSNGMLTNVLDMVD